MYQEMPYNARELILDYNEHILYTYNLSAARDYLSAAVKTAQFCLVTDKRLYAYSVDDLTPAMVYDINCIEGYSYTYIKKKRKLLYMLYAIPCLLIAALFFIAHNAAWNYGASGAIGVVFFFLTALIFVVLAVGSVIKAFHNMNRELHTIMHITAKDGSELRLEIMSTNTNEAKKLERAIQSAKSSQYAENPELFLY